MSIFLVIQEMISKFGKTHADEILSTWAKMKVDNPDGFRLMLNDMGIDPDFSTNSINLDVDEWFNDFITTTTTSSTRKEINI